MQLSTPIEEPPANSIEKAYLDAYEENMPRIFRHINSRVNDRKVAEDLTSETFFRTWDYIRKENTIINMKAFCFKVANHLIVDHYQARHPSISLEAAEGLVVSSKQSDNPELQTELSLLRDLMADLPSEYGAILAYRYIDDLDISEITKITGKSQTHIYVLIHRAKNALRKKLKAIP
jgi:RNA polymerase sigma-70 factor (ECF subfamily)